MHLVGILFPHINDDAWSKPHQKRLVKIKCVEKLLSVLTAPDGEGGSKLQSLHPLVKSFLSVKGEVKNRCPCPRHLGIQE